MAKHVTEFVLSVSDRASAVFHRVTAAVRKARKEAEGLEDAVEDAGEAIEENLDGKAVEDLGDALDDARKKTRQLGDEAKKSGDGFGGMARQARGFVKALAAAEVTKAIVKEGKAAVAAASQMERYQATLETMLGSRDAARERMEEYKDVAKVTPFEMSEVVEAGNQLQAIGRYSRKNLEMLGDLAAANGKPMEQVMNAYAKLATGQKGEAARMFQDLLITRDDWVAATGKGVSKSGELLASTEEMLSSLPKIMAKKGYGGMMAKQAATTGGALSNLEDSVFSLRAAVGERLTPTVRAAAGGLSKMASSMERAAKISLPEKITQEKVELNLLVGALESAWGAEDRRGRLLDEIKSKYPEFLKGFDAERDGLQKVKDKLVEVNAEYDKKIEKAYIASRLAVIDDEVESSYGDLRDAQNAKKARERNEEIARQVAEWKDLRFGEHQKLGKSAAQYLSGAKYDPERGQYYYQFGWKKKYFGASANGLIAEYQANEKEYLKPLYTVNTSDKKLAKLEHEYETKMAERNNLLKLAGVDVADGSNGSNEPNGSTEPNGSPDGLNGQSGTAYSGGFGSGGGSGKIVTTNIGTLVGRIDIHTSNLTEGTAEVKRLVAQALLEAVPSEL